MNTRSTHVPPQTIRQAKAQYKKNGPRISTQESRQLERGAELLRRAEKLKDAERRKKINLKKKQQKEQRERESRSKAGILSPRTKVRASQGLLDTFVKCVPAHKSEDESSSSTTTEPWDDEIDDSMLIALHAENIECGDRQTKTTSSITPKDLDVDLNPNWDDFLTSNSQIQSEIAFSATDTLGHNVSSAIYAQGLKIPLDDAKSLARRKQQCEKSKLGRDTTVLCTAEKRRLRPYDTHAVTTPETLNQNVDTATSLSFTDSGLSTQDLQEIDLP